jgi:hypothetical protein
VDIGTDGTTHNTVNINNRRTIGVWADNVSSTNLRFGNYVDSNPQNSGGYSIFMVNSSAATTLNNVNISNSNRTTGTEFSDGSGLPFISTSKTSPTRSDGDGIMLISNPGSLTINGGTISAVDGQGIDHRDSGALNLSNVIDPKWYSSSR